MMPEIEQIESLVITSPGLGLTSHILSSIIPIYLTNKALVIILTHSIPANSNSSNTKVVKTRTTTDSTIPVTSTCAGASNPHLSSTTIAGDNTSNTSSNNVNTNYNSNNSKNDNNNQVSILKSSILLRLKSFFLKKSNSYTNNLNLDYLRVIQSDTNAQERYTY
jgi:hypothetical protein